MEQLDEVRKKLQRLDAGVRSAGEYLSTVSEEYTGVADLQKPDARIVHDADFEDGLSKLKSMRRIASALRTSVLLSLFCYRAAHRKTQL